MSKAAIMTGGKATAEALARAGWSVGTTARDENRLRAAEEELRAFGVKALGISDDAADQAAVDVAAARFEHELGPFDVWVINSYDNARTI